MVFGANARSGIYRRIGFSSGQFACYAESRSRDDWRAFDMAGLPNNHLLADDPTIAKTLESARVGDQIHFRGYLAGYSHRHGFAFRRGTSTTRTDNGDGAYATEARIVRQGNRGWRAALWAGIATFVAGLFAWLAAPHGASDEASSLHGAANRH